MTALARVETPLSHVEQGHARVDQESRCKALWAGVAAHALHRLDRPMTSAVGAMLVVAGHAHGWVVAEGGSSAISDALLAELLEHLDL